MLIVADRPVDINLYLSQFHLQFEALTQIARKLLLKILKSRIVWQWVVNAVDTEYYILFRDKSTEVLQKRVQTLISQLASTGLVSRQVSQDDLSFYSKFLKWGVKNDLGR